MGTYEGVSRHAFSWNKGDKGKAGDVFNFKIENGSVFTVNYEL